MRGNGGKRRVRAALACAGLAALAAVAAPASATASTALPEGHGTTSGHGKPGYTLPEGTPKPEGDFTVRSVYKVVRGVQTYTCTADGTWGTASTPEARLVRYGGPGRIHHYAGPRWTSERDGSTLLGTVVTRVPQTGTIPWLLLSTVAEKPGRELGAVQYISRVNTSGGVAPTGTCTPGATQSVRYGAAYVFWVPKA